MPLIATFTGWPGQSAPRMADVAAAGAYDVLHNRLCTDPVLFPDLT
jgi:hypothetical protein